MNIALWALQVILGIKLLTVTLTHGLQQSKPTVQEAISKMGKPARPLLILAAVTTLLGTAGIILPGSVALPGWLTPVSALFCAFLLLGSLFFHLRSREKPKIFVSIILTLFALTVAYGRWVVSPF